ncbi:ATP-binding protein [Succinimonas sp.]|uniref:ATP-binding protein n=1 Tax=Succinimonas sp. TaxID=1936151 RepID=UPI0038680E7F
MERFILKKLIKWKDSPCRKPLILQGVRQVGKTWILKEFGRRCYENVAYFNFEEHEEFRQFFETTKNVSRILQNLMMTSGQKIVPEKTLIIFDEAQDCPNVINSLKDFCENAPEYHIASAGSLLGTALAKPSSFPVGKVSFMQLDPMTFSEFLIANGDANLADFLKSTSSIEPIPAAFFNPLCEKLKMYYVTGGMPEAVRRWTELRDVAGIEEALSDIIGAYERDFARYAGGREYQKLSLIWKSVPSQLARENKKFLYRVVKNGARAREYEDALEWLKDARLVHKIYRSAAPRLPEASYDDLSAFKIYLTDVGLLRRLSNLAPTAFGEGNRLFTEFKGALTENFVLESLITQFEVVPRYWSQTNPPYEVDFLIQRENDIFPVEVKSEAHTAGKSLRKFRELFPDLVKLRVRFSLDNLKLDDDVLNIPLFMADETDRLIGLTLDRKCCGCNVPYPS